MKSMIFRCFKLKLFISFLTASLHLMSALCINSLITWGNCAVATLSIFSILKSGSGSWLCLRSACSIKKWPFGSFCSNLIANKHPRLALTHSYQYVTIPSHSLFWSYLRCLRFDLYINSRCLKNKFIFRKLLNFIPCLTKDFACISNALCLVLDVRCFKKRTSGGGILPTGRSKSISISSTSLVFFSLILPIMFKNLITRPILTSSNIWIDL